jgi:hypothetical protein
MTLDKTYSLIYYTINQLAETNVTIVREIPQASSNSIRKPSFVLLEYRKGLLGMSRYQIELTLRDRQTKTVVSLKWFYPTYEQQIQSNDGLTRRVWMKRAREAEERTRINIEELKSRINATEITSDEEARVKEIIKEKEVIVKVRCPYCKNLYDETLDKCPHCGGHA